MAGAFFEKYARFWNSQPSSAGCFVLGHAASFFALDLYFRAKRLECVCRAYACLPLEIFGAETVARIYVPRCALDNLVSRATCVIGELSPEARVRRLLDPDEARRCYHSRDFVTRPLDRMQMLLIGNKNVARSLELLSPLNIN